jgi:hypothetical protein
VFRPAVLSLVLMVGVAQDAALFCKAWCDPAQAAKTGCHQQDTNAFPRVTGSDNCGPPPLNGAVLVREDVRRGTSDPGARHSVVIPRYQVPLSPSLLRLGSERGRTSPIEPRPLARVLRI